MPGPQMLPAIDPVIRRADESLARDIQRLLHELYPGWQWLVQVPPNPFGKPRDDIMIRNLDCDPRAIRCAYIRKSALSGANIREKVMRFGGEFLERYNMRRAAFRWEEIDGRQMIFEKPEA